MIKIFSIILMVCSVLVFIVTALFVIWSFDWTIFKVWLTSILAILVFKAITTSGEVEE